MSGKFLFQMTMTKRLSNSSSMVLLGTK